MRIGRLAPARGGDRESWGFEPHGGVPRFWQSRLLVAFLLLLGAAGLNAQAEPVRIVVLGDSLVAGYMLPRAAAFPAVLERKLRAAGRDVKIENAGVSGDTAAGGLARLDWSVPDGTDLVIVELGANDMLRGLDPERTRATLDTIFRRVHARGMGLAIAGMRSINNWGPEYRQKFDAIYPDLARAYGAPLYPFFMDGVYGHPERLLPDGLHPSAAGVEAMVDNFLPFITPIVDRAAAKAKG